MTKTDTIGRVARPRGVLSKEQIEVTEAWLDQVERTQQGWRGWVVTLLAEGCSFNEVSKATGLSKDTLQRWKREAGK